MGRAVYEGVYDPKSSTPTRTASATTCCRPSRRLRMTAMRYPGGNFASGYHWQDGVGPREQRPTVRELAWQSIEPNQFGTDEFMPLCRKMDWTPMLTVNLGTGTPEEARNWVEYCNCPPGTKYADLRAANGQPGAVRRQAVVPGQRDGRPLAARPRARRPVRHPRPAGRQDDEGRRPDASRLVACGSCTHRPAHLHGVGPAGAGVHRRPTPTTSACTATSATATTTRPTTWRSPTRIDRQIEEMDAVCRFVQARRRSKKRAYLCFDEWNVWYKNRQMDGEGKLAPHLIEEVYNLEDALVVAGFLQQLHPPRRRA